MRNKIELLKSQALRFQKNGNLKKVVEIYLQILDLDNTNIVALNDLGSTYRRLLKYDLSLQTFNKAISIYPNIIELKFNKANLLNEIGRFSEALNLYKNIISINPNVSDAYLGLAIAQNACGFYNDSLLSFKRSVELDPFNLVKYSAYLFKLSHTENIDQNFVRDEHFSFDEKINSTSANEPNLILQNFTHSQNFTIGIVSADFHHHAITTFIEDIFINIFKYENIKLVIFYNNNIFDEVNKRLREYPNIWVDIYDLSDSEVFKLIQDHQINALIDLSGHTKGNRLSLFSQRAAPLQVSWMGYPGTTGLKNMDYIICDKFYIPEKLSWQFRENLLWLPISAIYKNSFDIPNATKLPFISNSFITFGSFNRINKITRSCISIWSRILKSTNSKMIIGGMPTNHDNIYIKKWFNEEGVDLEKITFHSNLPISEYFSLISKVDLCLDTFPYTGGTTTWHSAFMGVPTITLEGENAAQRVSSTILNSLQLNEFIAANEQEYIAKALFYANNEVVLQQIRTSLRSRYFNSFAAKPKTFSASLILGLQKIYNILPNKLNVEINFQDSINYYKSNKYYKLAFNCFLKNNLSRSLYFINKSLFYKNDNYSAKKLLGAIHIIQESYAEGISILEKINDFSDLELLKNLLIAYSKMEDDIKISDLTFNAIRNGLSNDLINNLYIEYLIPKNYNFDFFNNVNFLQTTGAGFYYKIINRLLNFGSESKYKAILNIIYFLEKELILDDDYVLLKYKCLFITTGKALDFNEIYNLELSSHIKLVLIGDLHTELNNVEIANDYYLKSLAIKPNHPLLIRKLVNNQILINDKYSAFRICSLYGLSENVDVLISISKVFSHFGDFESSLSSLLKALNIESNSKLLYEISLVFYKINDIEKSLNYAFESLTLDRFNLSSLCFTIELLAKLDNKEITYKLMEKVNLLNMKID